MIGARIADDRLPGNGSRRTAIMEENRTFVLERMFGSRRLEFANIPGGWHVKAVRYGERDVTDDPVEFTTEGRGTLEVLLSTRGAFATGRVVDDRGAPVGGGRVLMLRADGDVGGFDGHTSVQVRPDGSFRVGPTRPGAYVLVAVQRGFQEPHPDDVEALAALRSIGRRLTLVGEGEHPIELTLQQR